MTNKEIYNRLRAAGMTAEGACGMLGNMAAESAMRPDNAQDSYGIPDDVYVAQVDGEVRDFLDSVGFGLCQWTLASRKAKLLAFARARGVSIADPAMQVDFVIRELQDYPEFADVRKTLCTSHDLRACTKIVMDIYENPDVKNLAERLVYAKMAFDDFGKTRPASGSSALADFLPLLVGYLQTEEFAEGFGRYLERGESNG